ncbi:Light-harvesting complex [Amphidinium carterae]
MAASKPAVALASLAAVACPAAAFQPAPNAMHPAANEGTQARAHASIPAEMSWASSASSTVSSGVVASGVTLAAAAVLMANTRHVAKPQAKTVLMAFESERGVQDPVGFFDPLGFTADGSVENFKRRRQTEIKHGRVAMLATMGYITPEITGKLPGYLSPSTGVKYDDIPNGLGAISKVPAAGWGQMIAYAAFCELSQDQSAGTPAAEGDFGFKVLTSSDPAELEKKLSAEIANGRLAMMAIIGMFFQDGLTGSAWGDWASYTASPLRAFESERGVQDPVGFFDPLGFTADGSVENFKRRRQTEIKHGRVAMLATMGYITPEITGKLPGYLSPSTGVKYDDIPNGLGAISKVPAAGWGQMIAYAAFCELSQDQSAGTPAAEGDFGFKVLTSSDPAELEKKLSAEIANGRLAMMAIIGMFFQDGLTGSAWGDWASYTASPLRAFESERGVQDPVGFFDPLGFTADGSVENFKRRRQTEIKHGRVAMLATMGYITPEITGKLPGYLSPSTGVKYDDIPNGLGAISKVPAAGWGQMIAYAAFCELSQDQSAGTPAAEGDFGFKVLTSSDPAELEKKLSAEIANGRLAMMAIIGMFFQDGLTGSAWGDWASYTASPLRAFESERGVQDPVGFFDPLGFTADGSVENFKRRRQTEIKHGRVAMLATMGYITPEITGKLPGYLSPSTGVKYDDIPNGLGAISKVPAAGWGQMIAYAAFCELSQDQSAGTPAAEGDFGFKVLTSSDPAELEKKLSAEIANGRLAMMAIIGMFFQDGLTGSAWGDWASYTASPLRAFESERGVQDPVGFFDPLGFTADGSVENFKRRRQTEIKHGRVAMLATMGYITPEITGKLPGYLSPSTGVKYDDIPNGLGAISKVPAAGWGQMIAYAAFCELSQDQSAGTPAAEGDFGFKVLTSSDPAELEKKLSAEIANGRLAMMAIIGMFFQDGLTGSAWGDWASYTASPLRAEPVSAAAGAAAAAAAKAAAGAAGAKAAAGAVGAKAAAGTAGAKAAAGTAAVKGSGAVGAGAGTGKSIQKEEEVKSKPGFDPSTQLGAMPPLGFWDPAGFAKVGDEAGFRNLRAAEIKHGRVAMMAAVGGVVQHYVQFPGFESVPKGLGAVTTVPGSYGVAALFIAAGLLELGAWTESPDKEPGNFGDPAGLSQYTEEMRLRELNNGRFAMFAAIGIIAAELYTGLDAVEQLSI